MRALLRRRDHHQIRRVVQIASEALIEAIEANTTLIGEGALQNALGIV